MPALTPAAGPTSGSEFIGAVLPNDDQFSNQWHLHNTSHSGIDLNVTEVWDEYTGRGVLVGILDEGVEYTHPDLAANYRQDKDWDIHHGDDNPEPWYPGRDGDNHGTAVAGMIAGAIDGKGSVGVAPDAWITAYKGYLYLGTFENEIAPAFQKALENGVDVLNNSWGMAVGASHYYYDDFRNAQFSAAGQGLADLASQGRDGLGASVVFSAGNGAEFDDDVNYHNFQNSRYGIAVGATTITGTIAGFSTPGAAVLVSAPGYQVVTTDRARHNGYIDGDYVTVNGTSFSAPATAGVIALMYEANANLGYRDVQEILAYSANAGVTQGGSWQTNGATNWNGGGLTFDRKFGYGLVDAHAAVRLAETWTTQRTEANIAVATYSNLSNDDYIADYSTVTKSVYVSQDIEVNHVVAHVRLDHTYVGDLTITLTSPSGTVSTLIERPYFGQDYRDNLDFDYSSVQHWGESSRGTWSLKVTDSAGYDRGYLRDWDLSVYGDAASADDTYFYTNQWGSHGAETARRTITDTSGTDTLNFSAVTAALDLSLMPGTSNTFMGRPIIIGASTTIEKAYGGDAGDSITGNAADNTLFGMRGDDTLSVGAGTDVLVGGAGDDRLIGGAGADTAQFSGNYADYTVTKGGGTVTVSGGEGTDVISEVEFLQFADGIYNASSVVAGDDTAGTAEDTALVIQASNLLANDVEETGGSLTITAVGAAAHGSVSINGDGNVVYTPNGDYSGADSFTYTATNAGGGADDGGRHRQPRRRRAAVDRRRHHRYGPVGNTLRHHRRPAGRCDAVGRHRQRRRVVEPDAGPACRPATQPGLRPRLRPRPHGQRRRHRDFERQPGDDVGDPDRRCRQHGARRRRRQRCRQRGHDRQRPTDGRRFRRRRRHLQPRPGPVQWQRHRQRRRYLQLHAERQLVRPGQLHLHGLRRQRRH